MTFAFTQDGGVSIVDCDLERFFIFSRYVYLNILILNVFIMFFTLLFLS